MIDEDILNMYRAALIAQCLVAGGSMIIKVPEAPIPEGGTLMCRWVPGGIEFQFVPDGQAH